MCLIRIYQPNKIVRILITYILYKIIITSIPQDVFFDLLRKIVSLKAAEGKAIQINKWDNNYVLWQKESQSLIQEQALDVTQKKKNWGKIIIFPDTFSKCFAKAGFGDIEEAYDDDNQPLQKLATLLRRVHLDIDAEAVVSFDKHLRNKEGFEKAEDLVRGDSADQEDDGVNIDEESSSGQTVEDLKTKTYSEAL
uniref:Uncharacterized protein n=1 Tax=Timema tahoe TaxID=61484 RepID=A0A7R9FN18_9NEOP|nr:unnamed protein product [Timema tahoe]